MALGFLRRLHQRLIAYGKLLLAEHRSPFRVAAAILLGCIVGCLPLIGVQVFICMALSRVLRLNLPILYGAANISIPPLLPLIAWGSVQLGEGVLHGRFLQLSRAYFHHTPPLEIIKRFFATWMVGGTILGGAVGGLAGAIVYAILRRKNRREQLSDVVLAALYRASLRYRGLARKFHYYAAAKYRLDPCYRVLCARIAEESQVIDLGCGLAMLGVALAELGGGRKTLGIDWDAEKLAAGMHAVRNLPPHSVTLVRDDVRTAALPACDVITLIDVLHYYDPDTQSAILKRTAAALKPGGKLFIRETDPQRSGGARFTRFFERAMVRLGWNCGPKIHYLPVETLKSELQALNFTTEQVEVAGATHPGNILLCAEKSI